MRAIVSVSDKAGVADFAKELSQLSFNKLTCEWLFAIAFGNSQMSTPSIKEC